MMTKKKLNARISNLEGKVEGLEQVGKVAIITTGASAAVGLVTGIANMIWNHKNSKSIDVVADYLATTIPCNCNSVVDASDDETESVEEDDSESNSEPLNNEKNSGAKSNLSKLDAEMKLFTDTLSPIKFDEKVSINVDTLKGIVDYCFPGTNATFTHCEPCHLENDKIVGSNELTFILYLPENKYKVSVDGHGTVCIDTL
jgi:hypothetical protein